MRQLMLQFALGEHDVKKQAISRYISHLRSCSLAESAYKARAVNVGVHSLCIYARKCNGRGIDSSGGGNRRRKRGYSNQKARKKTYIHSQIDVMHGSNDTEETDIDFELDLNQAIVSSSGVDMKHKNEYVLLNDATSLLVVFGNVVRMPIYLSEEFILHAKSVKTSFSQLATRKSVALSTTLSCTACCAVRERS